MLYPAKGIVLRCVRFGDTSVIAKVYTDKFGLQSYLINGVRTTKTRNRQAMLQPLTLLNLVVYHREHKNLQRIREMSFEHVFCSVPFDIVRTSIAMFITEVLNKTLREETASEEIFTFLQESILRLDENSGSLSDFHIHFLAGLARLLGFAPANTCSSHHRFFDLEGGSFVEEEPAHYNIVETEDTNAFSELFNGTNGNHITLSGSQRSRLLEDMLLFYRLHVEDFGQMKSHKVLQVVLN